MITKILTEAVVVGIILMVVGKFTGPNFFFAGFLVHLLCEITGLNRWYCKNGAACISN